MRRSALVKVPSSSPQATDGSTTSASSARSPRTAPWTMTKSAASTAASTSAASPKDAASLAHTQAVFTPPSLRAARISGGPAGLGRQ